MKVSQSKLLNKILSNRETARQFCEAVETMRDNKLDEFNCKIGKERYTLRFVISA